MTAVPVWMTLLLLAAALLIVHGLKVRLRRYAMHLLFENGRPRAASVSAAPGGENTFTEGSP